MTIHWTDHLLFALFALILPILDTIEMRGIKAKIRSGDATMRSRLYRTTFWKEWVLAGIVVIAWWWLGRGVATLGLTPRTDGLAWVGHLVALGVSVLLVLQLRGFSENPQTLQNHAETLESLRYMAPHTRDERRLFDHVSVAAGICEEIIYRGFLIAYVMNVAGVSFFVAAVISSVIFGLAHSYQGVTGILKTAAIGGVMALLYGLTGALWAPMVVHAIIDITSGRAMYVAVNSPAAEPEAGAPAA